MNKPRGQHQQVVIGLLSLSDQRILISQRQVHQSWSWCWEFPGGKVEAGETPFEALQREFFEEIGIHILAAKPYATWYYPSKHNLLELHVWSILRYSGSPYGREGQSVRFCPLAELKQYAFLPANSRLIHQLQLPTTYVITPPAQTWHLSQLKQLLNSGMRLFRLRDWSLNDQAYEKLALTMNREITEYHGTLLLDRGAEMASRVGAGGIHLSSIQLHKQLERSNHLLTIASCHNQQELALAEEQELDAVTLSPVCQLTHDRPHLGWNRFASFVANCSIPVFALGGINQPNLPHVKALGGFGIAGIRAFWQSALDQE